MKLYSWLGFLVLVVLLSSAQEGFKNEMFIFAKNKASPSCCPSTYSSDMGCVCVNDQQYDYLSQRGGNKTSPGDF